MTPSSALITGIGGQDGSLMAEELVSQGWTVCGTIRPGSEAPQHLSELTNLELYRVELSSTEEIEDVIALTEPDYVFHLGGLSSVWRSWEQAFETSLVNGLGTAALLEACWRRQDRTGKRTIVVNASSAEIFSAAGECPQSETTFIAPTSPYGAAKAFGHAMCQAYRIKGLIASNAILYNHESHRRPTTFVTRKITSTVASIVKTGKGKLILGNMEARRDWGWAPDYVQAMMLMAELGRGEDFVIGTGQTHTVQEFVQTAFAAAGIGNWSDYVITDASLMRSVDAPELCGNASKAQRLLGWQPRLTFEQIVGRMVEYDLELDPAERR